jgi:hypothetical protein
MYLDCTQDIHFQSLNVCCSLHDSKACAVVTMKYWTLTIFLTQHNTVKQYDLQYGSSSLGLQDKEQRERSWIKESNRTSQQVTVYLVYTTIIHLENIWHCNHFRGDKLATNNLCSMTWTESALNELYSGLVIPHTY